MNREPPIQHFPQLFSQPLLNWFDTHGRHDLPWQENISPYRVWVSEIMLQQTQVATVIPYFKRFMLSFPNVEVLAKATQDEVLSHWAGLGYYARGRNLHKAARQIVEQHDGIFPSQFDDILALPGIGRSTAGAILSISLNQRFAILDGNVKRVLSRYFGIHGWPGEKKIEADLWHKADLLTPPKRFADYTQAIMDLGATTCKRSKPLCGVCPVQKSCVALKREETHSIPASKPKKDKPVKRAFFLLLLNSERQVLLRKRPQKGVWAGLWSLPEFDSLQGFKESIESQTTVIESLVEWNYFRHTFTHYHLDIYPLVYRLDEGEVSPVFTIGKSQNNDEKASAEMNWIELDRLNKGEVGVPAPVNKMLERLSETLDK